MVSHFRAFHATWRGLSGVVLGDGFTTYFLEAFSQVVLPVPADAPDRPVFGPAVAPQIVPLIQTLFEQGRPGHGTDTH